MLIFSTDSSVDDRDGETESAVGKELMIERLIMQWVRS